MEIIPLQNRGEMYKTCERLINSAKNVVDMSWGQKAEIGRFKTQKNDYQKAKDNFIKSKDIHSKYESFSYREIISSELSKETEAQGFNTGNTKVFKNDFSLLLIEFMIFDQKSIILSRAYEDGENMNDPRYYLIHDEKIASMFYGFFEDVWTKM